jgi:hypothetical protein
MPDAACSVRPRRSRSSCGRLDRRRSSIRHLTGAAIALALAALAGTGTVAGLHALQRGDVPRAASPPRLRLPDDPAPPQPLPAPRPIAGPSDAALTRVHALRRPVGPLDVTLHAAAPLPAGAGIAVLDGVAQTRLAWQGIATDGGGTLSVRFAALPVGRHTVVLAPRAAAARFSYWLRTEAEVTDSATASVTMEVTVQDVEIELGLPTRLRLAAPVTLVRGDDPSWHPAEPLRPAALERPSRRPTIALGRLAAGDYRLLVEGVVFDDGARELIVRVPGPTRITASARPQ